MTPRIADVLPEQSYHRPYDELASRFVMNCAHIMYASLPFAVLFWWFA